MRANFEESYRRLPPAAARLFRLLSLGPGDEIGPAVAGALADVAEPEAGGLLAALAAHGLLAGAGPETFRLPGPLRDRAADLAEREEPAAEREAALRRVLDHCLAGTATAAAEPAAGGLALLDRERLDEAVRTLEEVLRRAADEGDPHAVLRARHDLARVLIRAGDPGRAIELLGPLPEEFAALPRPDDGARAAALTGLGEAHLRAGRPVAATNFFGQALDVLRGHGAPAEQARVFVHLAEAARLRGDRPAARAALARAVELACSAGPEPDGGQDL